MDSLGYEDQEYFSPLCRLAAYYALGHPNMFQAANKFKFLLRRGANVRCSTPKGNTCLHSILQLSVASPLHLVGPGLYDEDEFMSILMAMITAGVDVRAVNKCGLSVSNYACLNDNQEVWIQALAACGHNPWDVFTLEDEWSHICSRLGENVFFAGTIITRPTVLSFEEYYNQQTSIGPVDECLRVKQSIERIRTRSRTENLTGNESPRCDCRQWRDCQYSDEYSDSDSNDDDEWENASDYEEDHYIPRDDDPNWMVYIPHHQFL